VGETSANNKVIARRDNLSAQKKSLRNDGEPEAMCNVHTKIRNHQKNPKKRIKQQPTENQKNTKYRNMN